MTIAAAAASARRRPGTACVIVLIALGTGLAATSSARTATFGSAQPPFGNCLEPPEVDPSIPSDAAAATQADMNCFAWQQFIALNWPADLSTCSADTSLGPDGFGEPTDMAPVVWETYKLPEEVFLEKAAEPDPWCDSGGAASETKPLDDVTPFDPSLEFDLREFKQVAPPTAWVTSQGGFVTFVEIKMNEDEFEYIVDEKLYDADNQASVAESEGINFPAGQDGNVGSIELKASWVELPDESLYPFFKTRQATLHYPGEPARTGVVGLVGLHIIHKTNLAPQFVWATFEHKWNAPNADDLPDPSASPYTYYNPDCDPATDHFRCQTNDPPAPTTDPIDAPNQVVRSYAIPSETNNDVVDLNADVSKLIRQANTNSVFQNYELVNVLWPTKPQAIGRGATAPLPSGEPAPTDQPVANTTLETYAQGATCLTCHVNAEIAGDETVTLDGTRDGDGADYAADYSFLLHHAKSADGTGLGTVLTLVGAGAAAAAAGTAVVIRRRRRTAG